MTFPNLSSVPHFFLRAFVVSLLVFGHELREGGDVEGVFGVVVVEVVDAVVFEFVVEVRTIADLDLGAVVKVGVRAGEVMYPGQVALFGVFEYGA